MTTDPRYLVPLSALPFRPHGATLAWECKTCGWVFAPHSGTTLSCEHADGPNVAECLDLSAPPGDPPTRLDALGWALDVLSARLGVEVMRDAEYQIHPQEVTRDWHVWTWGPHGPGYRVALATYADVPPTGDINADRRAVVAHALRNHVPKESP